MRKHFQRKKISNISQKMETKFETPMYVATINSKRKLGRHLSNTYNRRNTFNTQKLLVTYKIIIKISM